METQKANISAFRLISAWLVAVLLTALIASFASTHNTLSGLRQAGLEIPLGKQISTSFQDALGLVPMLAIFIGIGFLIAFGVAALLVRRLPKLRTWIYIGAGMICMWVMFTLMEKAFFGTPIIQGARSATGVFIQMLCGGIGGGVLQAYVTKM